MYVVKVGGSLMDHAREVMGALEEEEALIVPGGGIFADAVREAHRRHGLSEVAAHRMAIRAMDIYGLFLSDISGIPATEALDAELPAVLLPSRLLSVRDPFVPSWRVTSDTIACHVAHLAGAELVLLKAVEGMTVDGRRVDAVHARELLGQGETAVDPELPRYLMEYRMDCLVLDGRELARGRRLRDLIGTRILGGHDG
ncbi:MAG: amino acid kinase [Candidatus Hydrothermarchaeota archaeon]